MLVDDDQIRALLSITDALQYAFRVFSNRLVRLRAGQVFGCLIWLVTRLNSKLVDTGPVGACAAAVGNQSRRTGYERDRHVRCAQIGWCCSFGKCEPRSGVNDFATVELAKCVFDAGGLQIEGMVVR